MKLRSRVARFVLVQDTQTGKNIPNGHKIYQIAINYFQQQKKRPNVNNYAKIFHCKNLQNLPKFWFENKPSGEESSNSKMKMKWAFSSGAESVF
jgi:hypothetical protein